MTTSHNSFDDDWTVTKRSYATRSRMEIYITKWLDDHLPLWTNKTLNGLLKKIEDELDKYKRQNAGPHACIQVKKIVAGKYGDGSIAQEDIILKYSNRAPFYQIAEPFR